MITKSLFISASRARKIILQAQGLTKTNPFGKSEVSVIKAVEHLGYVQLDTISVVERAHHHVLWSRIPAYEPSWLEKAQYKHRKIFEHWAHAAAYLPMKDYRFAIPVMEIFRSKQDRWPKTSDADMKKVLERVRNEGPLMSRDFQSDHKGGNWWDWKPPKWALQRLFLEGHLLVSHREGFQRVYDLPERIIPPDTVTVPPNQEEYYRYLIMNTLNAQGLATPNEISHLRKTDPKKFQIVLNELTEEKLITPVNVEKVKTYYTLPSFLNQKIQVANKVIILSPFDNLVIWRKRIKDIFNFDYTLECYVPSHKREFGYFCLPVLYRDQFMGRIDLKADRKNKTLQIKAEHWENNGGSMRNDKLYKEALKSFAAFNGCNKIQR